jgi:transposase-like protein
MKYSQSEKMEIIRMVEDSNLSVRKTLQQIDISRSTFYELYMEYQKNGYEGLAPKHRTTLQFCNAIIYLSNTRVSVLPEGEEFFVVLYGFAFPIFLFARCN